jgi:hypothetical protein
MQSDKIVGTAAAITSPGENKIANSLVDIIKAHMVKNSLRTTCLCKVVK